MTSAPDQQHGVCVCVDQVPSTKTLAVNVATWEAGSPGSPASALRDDLRKERLDASLRQTERQQDRIA